MRRARIFRNSHHLYLSFIFLSSCFVRITPELSRPARPAPYPQTPAQHPRPAQACTTCTLPSDPRPTSPPCPTRPSPYSCTPADSFASNPHFTSILLHFQQLYSLHHLISYYGLALSFFHPQTSNTLTSAFLHTRPSLHSQVHAHLLLFLDLSFPPPLCIHVHVPLCGVMAI